jgi:hypothetical protein
MGAVIELTSVCTVLGAKAELSALTNAREIKIRRKPVP